MSSSTETLLRPGARIPAWPIPQEGLARGLPRDADAIIVGAGVIGLSIGWRLAQAGLRTVILERGSPGDGASFAATGMLAAAAELEAGGETLLPFALSSQRLWRAFRNELEAASDIPLDYEASGTLVVALTRDETERLRARHHLHLRSGLQTAWLAGAEARRLEPGLRPSTAAAIYCADDHQVDPRRLVPALQRAYALAGGRLLAPCNVIRLDHRAGRCAGVETSQGACRTPITIIAAGAWAASEELFTGGIRAPLRPVKGQSLALRTNAASPPTKHVVWTEQVHIAPKADGHVIIGATVEEAGFDADITAGGVYALLEGVRRALPSVDEMAVDAIWCGFRPTSDDDAPILGPACTPGLVLAIGHHRNGILLAPATADAISRHVLGADLPSDARPLTFDRFRREA